MLANKNHYRSYWILASPALGFALPRPKEKNAMPSQPSTALYADWQALRAQTPMLRARDAAAQLGVSEAELTASRIGIDAVRLEPKWSELLPALGELGEVMALTRNEYCVHERKGLYHEVIVDKGAPMGLVVSADIDLRFFFSGWSSVFAIEEQSARGVQRSIQIFDKQGMAIHKVFLTENSQAQAFSPLLKRFRASEQSALLDLQPAPAAPAEKPDSAIDREALRADWAQLKDTHHFFALLKKHGVTRTQGLRLAGCEFAEPLDVDDLPPLLEAAAEHEVPIMLFVGNRHCIQIHSGAVHKLRWLDRWFNVLDEKFSLHLNTAGIASLWRVRKPSTDGLITSWEAFDARGELILQLFGARKPGIPERRDWRMLAEGTAALTVD